jgi:endonuclease IV
MAAFINHKAIRNLPIILETPIDEKRGDEQNLQVVLKLASGTR